MSKPKVVKDFDRLSDEIIAQLKLEYPYGFENKLIQFTNRENKLVSALPYETDDFYYLIRMTRKEAQEIINDDDDYNEEGNLTENAKERIEDEVEVINDLENEAE